MLNKIIANVLPHMPKKLVWIFSRRYIAGETVEDAVLASQLLNEKGIETTVDLLGEFINTLEEAEKNKNKYLDIIEYCTQKKVKGNFSLKPTMFGLLIDKNACYNFIREIVTLAVKKNSFIRIDMEDSRCVDLELEMFRKLKEEFPAHVGLVVQAYLKRTSNDIASLKDLNSKDIPLNFRLCKGIYVEPEEIAYKNFKQVQQQFMHNLEYMFRNKMYVGIATHDKFLVNASFEMIKKYKVPDDMYEFQMLFGVTPDLRNTIVKKGHRMRVYVPFGKQWFGYSTRRLKENPKIATDIIKALFIRG